MALPEVHPGIPTDGDHATPPSSPLTALTALTAVTGGLPHSMRGLVKSARELVRAAQDAPPPQHLTTLIPAFDELLGGGLPRGELVELTGRRSSGRFAIVLAVLAAATGAGELAALIDLGDHLDPQRARDDGVDLDHLLWVRPQRSKPALAAAEMLTACGFPLVVLDLGTPPIPGGRGQEGFWIRLMRAMAEYRTALLLSSPYTVSGTAAAFQVEIQNEATRWLGCGRSPRLLAGRETRLRLSKVRRPSARSITPGERRIVWSDPAAIASGASG